MQNKHVCSDAQAGGRVAEIAGMVNIVGANVGAISDKFIIVLKQLINIKYGGAVRRMRTRIGLLAQPEPMRSIIGATQ